MKRILATTALALVLSGGAYAAMSAELNAYQGEQTDISASDFLKMRIYATENVPAGDIQPGAEKEWDDIGEVDDVIFSRDGQVKAAIVGVGGFLGIGEKSVAIPVQDIKFVRDGDDSDDYFLVINANKDALTNATAYVAPAEKAAEQQAAATDTQQPAANGELNNGAVSSDTTASNTSNSVTGTDTTGDTAANSTATQPMDTSKSADTAANTTTNNADTSSTAAQTDTAANSSTTEKYAASNDTAANSSSTMKSDSASSDTAANSQTDGATTAAPADTAANSNAATDDTTTASTTGATDADRTLLTRPDINREGYASMQTNELTADKLQGATVYGPNDEDVAEINRIILTPDGKVDRVVLDVGGFLGIGTRQIAVTMDELNIVKNSNGDDIRVYIDSNQANLKAQPEYKG